MSIEAIFFNGKQAAKMQAIMERAVACKMGIKGTAISCKVPVLAALAKTEQTYPPTLPSMAAKIP